MFSTGIQGNLSQFEKNGREIDYVQIDWCDADKHILRLSTKAGRNIGIRKPEGAILHDGDVLYNDDQLIVAVHVQPVAVLRVRLNSAEQAALIGYELGNRHIPISITNSILETPFDESAEIYLVKMGFSPQRIETVPHEHISQQHHSELSPHTEETAVHID